MDQQSFACSFHITFSNDTNGYPFLQANLASKLAEEIFPAINFSTATRQ